MYKTFKIALLFAVVFSITSCATFYQQNIKMMDAAYKGDYTTANAILEKSKLKKQKRNQLLYLLNKGSLLFMENKFVESNTYFQQADYLIEDFQKNYLTAATSFVVNPTIQAYEGENFEKVLVHYYSTINYLMLGKLDEALVECKRMELKLQKITDYYKGKNNYKNDAFVYLLSGIVYDAQKDYNAAFIAYRNAYNVYKDEYQPSMGIAIPEQLKEDLIRSALLTGFTEEANTYKKEFKLEDFVLTNEMKNQAVVFWNNGLGPIKDEWSVNFSIIPAGNGYVNFTNWDLGINIPFYAGNDAKEMAKLNFIRVAFPKYVTREPVIKNAILVSDSLQKTYAFSEAENIDKIAYTSINDRFLKEMSTALARLALKQVAVAATNKNNEIAGSALSILNAVTEKADTRNWQFLPHTINYARIQTSPGMHTLTFKGGKELINIPIEIKPNSTIFKIIQSPNFKGYTDRKK